MNTRRTFLRGLASLPLIGGSVALIGQPTAVAVPVTPDLRDRYIAWLANEHAAALFERDEGVYRRNHVYDQGLGPDGWNHARHHVPMYWFPDAPDIEAMTAWSKPSTRAAIVLSAVGCGLGSST